MSNSDALCKPAQHVHPSYDDTKAGTVVRTELGVKVFLLRKWKCQFKVVYAAFFPYPMGLEVFDTPMI